MKEDLCFYFLHDTWNPETGPDSWPPPPRVLLLRWTCRLQVLSLREFLDRFDTAVTVSCIIILVNPHEVLTKFSICAMSYNRSSRSESSERLVPMHVILQVRKKDQGRCRGITAVTLPPSVSSPVSAFSSTPFYHLHMYCFASLFIN